MVTVSSLMHRFAHKPPLGDPQIKAKPYLRWVAYLGPSRRTCSSPSSSTRRLREFGRTVAAHAAHPGYAGTYLVERRFGRSIGGLASILDTANAAVGQSPAVGAWPVLMAATADLPGSTYCGPSGLGEVAGSPRLVGWTRQAGDRDSQRAAGFSEKATGITYP